MSDLAAIGAALLYGRLDRSESLAGGDLSSVLRIWLEDGRSAVVKGGAAPRTEALMLRAIGAAGAPAPEVLAVNDRALVMQALEGRGGIGAAWASLGAALARLHAEHGPRYGWPENYAFGPISIDNAWADDWPAFWAQRRLLAHVPHLSASLWRRVEALAADLGTRLPARPPPSLLHGDCWGGNVLAAGSDVTGLIDPACYFGHAEVDLAMLTLFDRPPPVFYAAYGPLAAGASERLAIYRLWPELVHLRLFGDAYRPLVEASLSAAGA